MKRKAVIKTTLTLSFPVLMAFTLSTNSGNNKNDLVDFISEYLAIKYKTYDLSEVVYIAVGRQKLYHIKQGELLAQYDISTSKKGIGTLANSKKTPTGLHRIKEKIGQGVPIGGIFENRVYKNETWPMQDAPLSKSMDLITTRILWLQGMEPGHNSGAGHDSYQRCIYIHGTHQEELIGQPASHGCIRMRNKDVVDLFDNIETGTYVVILNN